MKFTAAGEIVEGVAYRVEPVVQEDNFHLSPPPLPSLPRPFSAPYKHIPRVWVTVYVASLEDHFTVHLTQLTGYLEEEK